jgi:SAM-dependent methyltransferase
LLCVSTTRASPRFEPPQQCGCGREHRRQASAAAGRGHAILSMIWPQRFLGGVDLRPLDAVEYDYGWESKWDDMKKYGPVSRHVRRIIMDMIRSLKFDSVLDVGCGQGSLLADLRSKFPQVRLNGIDISRSAVELARVKMPNGRYWVLDVSTGHIPEKFDLVVCSEVLEHIPDDIAALRGLAAMTGKYLLVSTVQGRMRHFEATEVGHVRNYAPGELARKIQSVGLNPAKVMEWGFPLYSPIYRDALDHLGGRGTIGRYGPGRRLIAATLYNLFLLNSSTHGDELVVLAQPPPLSRFPVAIS